MGGCEVGDMDGWGDGARFFWVVDDVANSASSQWARLALGQDVESKGS